MISALAGWLCLTLFGLTTAPAAIASGIGQPRVGAAALSLNVRNGLMVLFRVARSAEPNLVLGKLREQLVIASEGS